MVFNIRQASCLGGSWSATHKYFFFCITISPEKQTTKLVQRKRDERWRAEHEETRVWYENVCNESLRHPTVAVVDMAWWDNPALVIGDFLNKGGRVSKAGLFIHTTTTAAQLWIYTALEKPENEWILQAPSAPTEKGVNVNGRTGSDVYSRVQWLNQVVGRSKHLWSMFFVLIKLTWV